MDWDKFGLPLIPKPVTTAPSANSPSSIETTSRTVLPIWNWALNSHPPSSGEPKVFVCVIVTVIVSNLLTTQKGWSIAIFGSQFANLYQVQMYQIQGRVRVKMCQVQGRVWVKLCQVRGRVRVKLWQVRGGVRVKMCQVRGRVRVKLSQVQGRVWVKLSQVRGTWSTGGFGFFSLNVLSIRSWVTIPGKMLSLSDWIYSGWVTSKNLSWWETNSALFTLLDISIFEIYA